MVLRTSSDEVRAGTTNFFSNENRDQKTPLEQITTPPSHQTQSHLRKIPLTAQKRTPDTHNIYWKITLSKD